MDDDFIFTALFIGAAFIILRRVNSQPGTFSPNSPDALENYTDDVIPHSVSNTGVSFIEQEEGLSLTPYADAGHTDIGYGHQEVSGDNFGTHITQLQAQNTLSSDLVTVENTIAQYVTVPINQNQYDALADFIYNVGVSAFANSTLLSLLNAGNYSGAASQFSRWVNSNGKVSAALQARRSAEQQQFQS